MKLTRRAFFMTGGAAMVVGFTQSPAEALSLPTKELIKISKWAYPQLKDPLLGMLADKGFNYVVEHYNEFVNVIVHATQEAMKAIEDVLRRTVDDHLFQIATSAIAAGIVITLAVTGPGSLWLVPGEVIVEAVGLPFALICYHEDLLNFIAGKAYKIS